MYSPGQGDPSAAACRAFDLQEVSMYLEEQRDKEAQQEKRKGGRRL